MSLQNILITIILGVVAAALLIWLFTDVLDADNDRRDRPSTPVVSTL